MCISGGGGGGGGVRCVLVENGRGVYVNGRDRVCVC